MTAICFIEHGGAAHQVDARDGRSLMQAAGDNNIGGVIAECGGTLSCATCHVYVDAAWADRLPAPSPEELVMLECVLHPQGTSRLSCQIKVVPELGGLVVRLPASQT